MKKIVFLMVLALGAGVLSGCQTVQTRAYSQGAMQDPGFLPELARDVETYQSDALFSQAPQCVMVLPILSAEIKPWQAEAMGQAVSRHVRDVVDRVIDAGQMADAAQRGRYDLNNPGDLKRLSRSLNCAYIVKSQPLQVDAAFAVIWTRNRVGLEAVLLSVSELAMPEAEQRVLWSARHAAQRADGSVPLSPLGLAGAVVSAGQLKADQDEVFMSLANTVARRIFTTLPDMRTPVLSAYRDRQKP